ncbi:MAG: arylsulfatase [Paenibacillaceae bacterium]|nr:arylsulfatase [Paenibacillaceae bacterium]
MSNANKCNVLLILCDDMGYSDLGCYGGEIDTPNLDRLAADGMRFTRFYNTARCAPSRASLLTGLHPHQTGIGILTYNDGPDGYPGNLNQRCVTMAEVLKSEGYRTYMSGKWHLANDVENVNDTWPLQRGFDRYFGTLTGSGSFYHPHTLTRGNESADEETRRPGFYYTDAISEEAVQSLEDHFTDHSDKPFFQYVAYTAPHWPLHAPPETVAKYRGRFDQGWDVLRRERFERMQQLGVVPAQTKLSERDPAIPAWEDASNREWLLRCMEVYAAQVDRMDQGIGKIIDVLERQKQLENTLILFLSDNGGCNEQIHPHPVPGTDLLSVTHTHQGEPIWLGNYPDKTPGDENTFQTYGDWANLSNTPYRLYKSWVHEGGISAPLIIHGPKSLISPGTINQSPGQLTDILPTILAATDTPYPARYGERDILPLEGISLLKPGEDPSHKDRCLYWEHQGNAAIRRGDWKLVRNYPGPWELYDMSNDATEMRDRASEQPQLVAELAAEYEAWAKRCGVIPREQILAIPGRITVPSDYFGWMI